MSRYWSPKVQGLSPYTAGEQPKIDRLIKLNTNENPFPPSPKVDDALASFSVERLRLYPDPDSEQLRTCIAEYHDLQLSNVFVGNGSDEVLAHVFYAFFQQASSILFPDITYSFYPVYCRLYDIKFETVPLAPDYGIDLDAYSSANGGVIFANPNAPTGGLLSVAKIGSFLARNTQSVVVVDEAYIDFAVSENNHTSASVESLIAEYENLLVVRTLSKSRSLAGLRLGYALGSPALIEGLQRVKDSFNSYPIDQLASEVAQASFSDHAYFENCVAEVIAQREFLVQALTAQGHDVLPSSANFIMVQFANIDAQKVFEALRERGILVRYFDKPRLRDHLRITISTESDNRALLDAVEAICC